MGSLEFEAGPFTVLFGKNNTGKTNILEILYGIFEPSDKRAVRARNRSPGSPQFGEIGPPCGDVYVELEQGVFFDDYVSAYFNWPTTTPPSRRIAFNEDGPLQGDPWDNLDEYGRPNHSPTSRRHTVARESLVVRESLHALFLDWDVKELHKRVEDAITTLVKPEPNPSIRQPPSWREPWPWLERFEETKGSESWEWLWRVNPAIHSRLDQLASLATDLLPDFVDDPIRARVIEPANWGFSTKVGLYYGNFSNMNTIEVDAAGGAAARWAAAALQIALHLMAEYPNIMGLHDLGPKGFSRHILLIDEPEAHLHPSAAASVVRWCQRMVQRGFTVVAASHHEEFLRAPADEVTLVHVTRTTWIDGTYCTDARTLDAPTTTQLQQLAADVGMHPAIALSLHRAILFVEGPLDEAVLDEYGGPELDAAGVKVIPIHGTRNLEGLVSAELATQLGIKTAVLTDATDPTTIGQRSRRKWSSEERKVVRVIDMAKEKGLPPPMMFGVPEDDLLFALPADAIRKYLNGPFPGWKELVAECRKALGKGPSDSVDWKSYARENYGLPITTAAGVRDIVRTLDLNNVRLPSIRGVIDEVVNWAK
jgi:energy-coupling factor transporter ATP-binding protein EcfA2